MEALCLALVLYSDLDLSSSFSPLTRLLFCRLGSASLWISTTTWVAGWSPLSTPTPSAPSHCSISTCFHRMDSSASVVGGTEALTLSSSPSSLCPSLSDSCVPDSSLYTIKKCIDDNDDMQTLTQYWYRHNLLVPSPSWETASSHCFQMTMKVLLQILVDGWPVALMPSLLDAVEGHAETGISFGQASDDDRENHKGAWHPHNAFLKAPGFASHLEDIPLRWICVADQPSEAKEQQPSCFW